MAVIKDFTTPQGIAATYHKLIRVEINASNGIAELMLAVFANAEAAASGSSALWHEYVRIPVDQFKQNPFSAFYPMVTQHPGSYLLGGANDEPAGATAFELQDPQGQLPDQGLLQQLKQARIEQMRQSREAVEFGAFEWDGSQFDATAPSVSRLIGAVMMAQAAIAAGRTYEVSWTLADNSDRMLSAADLIQVGIALAAHTTAAHDAYKRVKAAIHAAETIEAVQSITWPQTIGA